MIELSASEGLMLGSGLTIVGALMGALASVFSARLTAERQRLYEESATFRANFVDEIECLRKADKDVFRIIDDAVLAKHRRAKIVFEPWVARRKLERFNDAWNSYEGSIKTKSPGNIQNRQPECDSALANIELLLSFATHKG